MRNCTIVARMMTAMTTGIFQLSSWVNTWAQWQQSFSTLGVIRLHAGQIRRGAVGLRRQAAQNVSAAWAFPQYGQVHAMASATGAAEAPATRAPARWPSRARGSSS